MGQGETTNTLDAKGRLASPPGMRMELSGQANRPPVLTRLLEAPALGLYTAERWAEFRRRLDSLSQVKTSVQRVRRHVVGGVKEVPIDSQGRLLIPPHLREYAGLDRDVTILDNGTRFEIWDRSRHREKKGFRRFVNHPFFMGIPLVLETPKNSEDDDRRNLKTIRAYF